MFRVGSGFGYPFPWREALSYFGASTISWPFFLTDSLFYAAAGYLISIAAPGAILPALFALEVLLLGISFLLVLLVIFWAVRRRVRN